jgi:hypothetical protein
MRIRGYLMYEYDAMQVKKIINSAFPDHAYNLRDGFCIPFDIETVILLMRGRGF